MKKVILIAILAITLIVLSSCGNRQHGIDINQTFKTAYIRLGDKWDVVSVKSWRDFSEGDEVQIITDKGKVYLSHYSNMVLVN